VDAQSTEATRVVTRICRLVLLLGAIGLIRSPELSAQGAGATFAQGVRAYDDLEFDAAAGLLRRALAAQGNGALLPTDRERALMYLTATELLRENRDSARAVARRLVLSNPRFRPDELVFPPQVLQLYAEVRRTTPVVVATAPVDTAFRAGAGALAVRLHSSTVHDVSAALMTLEGSVLRTLHRGPIGDSLVIYWNGLDSMGTRLAAGRYAITVSSFERGRGSRVVRILRLPLAVLHGTADTLPLPPAPADTLLRSEREPVGPALRVLAPAVLTGAAIAVLPTVVGDGEEPSGGRLVIAGAVSLVGIAAFVSRRPGRPIPENVAHNRTVQDWRRAVGEITRRNAERSRELMSVRSDAPVIITPGGP
jgi:hypothetical protein